LTDSRPIDYTCTHPCHSEDFSTSLSNTDLSSTSIDAILDLCKADPDLLAKYRKALLFRQLVDNSKVEHDTRMLEQLKKKKTILDTTQSHIRKNMGTITKLLKTVLPAIDIFASQVTSITKMSMLAPELISLEIRSWNLFEMTLPNSLKENMFKTDKRSKATIKGLLKSLPMYFFDTTEAVSSVSSIFGSYVKKLMNNKTKDHNGLVIPRTIIDTKKAVILPAITAFEQKATTLLEKMEEFQDLATSLKTTMTQNEFTALYTKLEQAAKAVQQACVNFSPKAQKLQRAMQEVTVAIMVRSITFQRTQRNTKLFLNTLSTCIEAYNKVMTRYDFSTTEEYFTNLTNKAFDLVDVWRNITKEKLVDILTPQSDVNANITRYTRGTDKLMDKLHTIEETKEDLKLITTLIIAIQTIVKEIPALGNISTVLLPELDELKKAISGLYKPIGKIQKTSDYYLDMVNDLLAETVTFNATLQIGERMIRYVWRRLNKKRERQFTNYQHKA
jgi:PIN domain nuclease of toxin-antitoxin system